MEHKQEMQPVARVVVCLLCEGPASAANVLDELIWEGGGGG